ncbi:MAG: hypothetical protein K2Q03_07195 [Sphingobacteriaceae bacterium]|nr:hypothetical protein [Sphingobacteriaceae bacterium]
MKTIEEQLWDYLDGNCTANEKLEIELKISLNADYAALYAELSALQKMLETDDLEEPSMSFTRNVMEKVNLEMSPKVMKTKINTQLIYAIAGFFVLSIVLMLAYSLSKTSIKASNLGLNIDFPKIGFQKISNPIFLYLFMFFDVVLALVFADTYLRRKTKS